MRLTVLKNHVPINEVLVQTPDLNERYEIYVGRAEDCHVIIDDPLISRHHFVLKNGEGKWICEKLSILGGVSVGGISLSRMEIQNGNEIKFGQYVLIVSDLVNPPSTSVSVDKTVPENLSQNTETLEAKSDESKDENDEVATSDENEVEEFKTEDTEFNSGEESLSNDNLEDVNGDRSEVEHSFESESFNSEDNAVYDVVSTDNNDLNEVGESTQFFKTFVNYELVLFGEYAPYDRFVIDADEVIIGRDPKKCQIVLDDPEVSTTHAVLRKNYVDVYLEDLNSSNGTILNGERINKALLKAGDEFVIGSTSFTIQTKSDLLEAEADRLMPVESGQTIETEEIEEEVVGAGDEAVDFNSDAPVEKSIIKRIWKDPVKRKKAIYVIAGLALLYVFFGDDPSTPPVTEGPKVENVKSPKEEKPTIQLSKELEQKRDMSYELGVSFFEQNKYFEALKEFQTVIEIDPSYKNIQTYFEQTKEGLKRLEYLEAQKRSEEERLKNKKLIEEILVKARKAVKDREVSLAENYFSQIIEKDPENMEIQHLKMELEAWQKEQERIALEKAAKDAARKSMINALAPGKTYYLKKEWYKAILKLEDFLRKKEMDEDLISEASQMLGDAKNQLAYDLGPLLGKARSLKEGQDLKSAYEGFLDVLKVDPTNEEALNEVDNIKSQLETRSKKIYREAIIAESLSLFNDAKEKFQEVQQISPSDSEYYRKASDKLKNYLE